MKATQNLPPTKDRRPSAFIRALPKAELHLHLEGSIGPDELGELILLHGGGPVDRERLARLYQHKDFLGFLDSFKQITHWLRTPEDYELITSPSLAESSLDPLRASHDVGPAQPD